MKKNQITLYLALIMLFVSCAAQSIQAQAPNVIVNGGFETGDFTGWTRVNPAESFRPWSVSGSGSGGDGGGVYFPYPTSTIVQEGNFNAWNGVAAGAGQSFLLYQDVSIPANATAVRFKWTHRYQMNYTQFCSTACGTATFAVEILNPSTNVLRQTLYIVTTNTNTNTNTGFQTIISPFLQFYAGQTVRFRFRTTTTQRLQGVGQLEIDDVGLYILTPTSAEASVSGRVTTDGGRGISMSTVTLTDQTGNVRTTTTNQFGIYTFDEVESGQNYVVRVENKKYVFPNNPRVINIIDNAANVDFQANP